MVIEVEFSEKYLKILYEFFRYVIVGGVSFVADFTVLCVFKEFIFASDSEVALICSTTVGFIAGLLTNYILSVVFVFRRKDNKSDGKSVKGFVVFAIVGIIGLLLTEFGMYITVQIMKIHYMLSKLGVAGIVLIWNYCGRKILVFDKMG